MGADTTGADRWCLFYRDSASVHCMDVSDAGEPFPNLWSPLCRVEGVSESEVETLIAALEKHCHGLITEDIHGAFYEFSARRPTDAVDEIEIRRKLRRLQRDLQDGEQVFHAGLGDLPKVALEFADEIREARDEQEAVASRSDTGKTGSEKVKSSRTASPPEPPELSEAERQIMDVIRATDHRLTTKEILQELVKEHGAASEGTTKVNLATLRRRKLLTNRQDVNPKGYGLPEWD